MIDLHFSNGKAFIWNAEDICTLREEHRIVGSLIGCHPFKPFQVDSKWLPLQLMDEEVTLLIEKGIGQLVLPPNKVPDPNQIKSYYEKRNKLFEEQKVLLKESRKKEIIEMADKIYEGKKRKFMEKLEKRKKFKSAASETPVEEDQASKDQETKKSEMQEKTNLDETKGNLITKENIDPTSSENSEQSDKKDLHESEEFQLDKNSVIEAELCKVPEVDNDLCLVQLFTESPWKSTSSTVINWKYPSLEQDKLRYAVFKDLWEKKYYITSGLKFGGDFLAYEGDPLKFHAVFIVVCKCPGDKIQGNDIVVYGRLAHQVKKTVAIASLNSKRGVDYISVSWENKII